MPISSESQNFYLKKFFFPKNMNVTYPKVIWGPDHEYDNRFAEKNFLDLENIIFAYNQSQNHQICIQSRSERACTTKGFDALWRERDISKDIRGDGVHVCTGASVVLLIWVI